jgi:hypothetical protein
LSEQFLQSNHVLGGGNDFFNSIAAYLHIGRCAVLSYSFILFLLKRNEANEITKQEESVNVCYEYSLM